MATRIYPYGYPSKYPRVCQRRRPETPLPPTTPVQPHDLDRLRAEHPDLRVVDVRTPGQFAAGHIPARATCRCRTWPSTTPSSRRPAHPGLSCSSAGPGAGPATAEAQLAGAGLGPVHVLHDGLVGRTYRQDTSPVPAWTAV